MIISSTTVSSNSRADFTRSRSCSSSTPSSSISSIIAISSCSVTVTSFLLPNSLFASFLSSINKADRGVNMNVRNVIIPLVATVNPSEWSFARLFGITSPNASITSVSTTVDTRAALSGPTIAVASIVPSEDAVMFTMLFPISIVVITLSYLSSSLSAILAPLEPFSAMLLSLMRLAPVSAVSLAEKNAEQAIIIMIITSSCISIR